MVPTDNGALADTEIVEQVLDGQSGLYSMLMRRYNQRVYRVIRSILTSDEEAEDVVQEAWVRAYEHLAQFEGRASFSTWVTKIAFHEALARRRQSSRWEQLVGKDGEIMREAELQQVSAETPEDQAMRAQLGRMLQTAVDKLPLTYRSVFVMREVEHLSTAETADCLGVTQKTVKIRLHRSRALLRRELEGRAGAAIAEAYLFLGARCDRTVTRVLQRIPAPAHAETKVSPYRSS
jgi:RNA polymerase sigma-70 factor, ECF subfamily